MIASTLETRSIAELEKHEDSDSIALCSNQQSVKMELSNQEALWDKITKTFPESVTQEHVKTKEVIQEKLTVLKYLDRITSLEKIFYDTNGIILERAVELSQSLSDFEKLLHGKRPLSNEVSNCWTWLSKIAIMNQLHLHNTADYHNFYHEASELNGLMSTSLHDLEKNIASFDSKECKLQTVVKMTTLISETLSNLLLLSNRIESLTQRSYSIVPIYLRTQQNTQQPRSAKVIFRYETPEFVVNEGSEVLLIDNSDRNMWLICLNDGTNVFVPSLCVWIPSPDEEIIKLAMTLKDKLLDLWSQILHTTSVTIGELFISYFSDINKANSVYTPQNCRSNVDNFLINMDEVVPLIINECGQEHGTKLATLLQQTRGNLNCDEKYEKSAESKIMVTDIVQLDTLLSAFLMYLREYKSQHHKTTTRRSNYQNKMYGVENEQLLLANAFEKLKRFNDNNRSDLERVESVLQLWRKPITKFIRYDSRICLAGSLHSLNSPQSIPSTPRLQGLEHTSLQHRETSCSSAEQWDVLCAPVSNDNSKSDHPRSHLVSDSEYVEIFDKSDLISTDDTISINQLDLKTKDNDNNKTRSSVIEQSCYFKCDYKDVFCQYNLDTQAQNKSENLSMKDSITQTENISEKCSNKNEAYKYQGTSNEFGSSSAQERESKTQIICNENIFQAKENDSILLSNYSITDSEIYTEMINSSGQSQNILHQENANRKMEKRTMKIQKGVSVFDVVDCSTQCVFLNSSCSCMKCQVDHKEITKSTRRKTTIQSSSRTFSEKDEICQYRWTPDILENCASEKKIFSDANYSFKCETAEAIYGSNIETNLVSRNLANQNQFEKVVYHKCVGESLENVNVQSQFRCAFPTKENSVNIEHSVDEFSSPINPEIEYVKPENKESTSQHHWKPEVYSKGYNVEKTFSDASSSFGHFSNMNESSQTIGTVYKNLQTQFRYKTFVSDTAAEIQTKNNESGCQCNIINPKICSTSTQSNPSTLKDPKQKSLQYLQNKAHCAILSGENIMQYNFKFTTKEAGSNIQNSFSDCSSQISRECSEDKFQFRWKSSLSDNTACSVNSFSYQIHYNHCGNNTETVNKEKAIQTNTELRNYFATNYQHEPFKCDAICETKKLWPTKENCVTASTSDSDTMRENQKSVGKQEVLDASYERKFDFVDVDCECKLVSPTKENSAFTAYSLSESSTQLQPEISENLFQYKYIFPRIENASNSQYLFVESLIQIRPEFCEQISKSMVANEDELFRSRDSTKAITHNESHFATLKIVKMIQTNTESLSLKSTKRRTMKIQKGLSTFDVKDCSTQCLFPNHLCNCQVFPGYCKNGICSNGTTTDNTTQAKMFHISQENLKAPVEDKKLEVLLKDCSAQFVDLKSRCVCMSCL